MLLRAFNPVTDTEAVTAVLSQCFGSGEYSFEALDVFVAEVDRRIVGVATGRVVNHNTFPRYSYDRIAYPFAQHVSAYLCLSLAVLPSYRNLGIGQALVEYRYGLAARYDIAGIITIVWERPDGYCPAFSLYDKLGFSVVSRVPNLWDFGVDQYSCSHCCNDSCHCVGVVLVANGFAH